MMPQATFNFHDSFGLRVQSNNPKVLDFYKAEYSSASGPIVAGAKLVSLTWKKEIPRGEDAQTFAFHAHKLVARWFYKIEMFSDNVEIEVFGNQFAIPMVHHMLVHPSVRYLCAMNGTLMLHSSAVVQSGRSIVFTGQGGAGKTTLSSILLEAGGSTWQLHADDYVFLDPGPRSLAYVTRSHLYLALFSWLPQLQSRLSLREKMHIELFGRLRSLSKESLKWPLRLSESRLWPDHTIADTADLGAIVLIRRSSLPESKLIRVVNSDEVMDELLQMNFQEAGHFLTLMSKGSNFTANSSWESSWREAERSLLQSRLRETTVYWLDIPHQSSGSVAFANELLDLITPLVQNNGESVSNA
jgi:hypothetical protein